MKIWIIIGGLAVSCSCLAQYSTGFENSDGYTTGSVIGQNGWYLPVTGSTPASVEAYSGNSGGFVADPNGGSQFLEEANNGAALARASHAVNFSSGANWSVSMDLAVNSTTASGQTAGTNVGSLSLETYGTDDSFISENVWDNATTRTSWGLQLETANAAGVASGLVSPGSQFDKLLVNHWYRETLDFSFTTNLVTYLSLTDLSNSNTVSMNLTGDYLSGGATSTLALPSGIRLFGGGNNINGNQMGWDNVSVQPQAVPEPAPVLCLLLGVVGIAGLRRKV